MWENGSSFLYVDGECHFWVQAGDLWNETREGVLTPKEEESLIEVLHFGEWGELAGAWHNSSAVFDADATVFYDQRNRIACSGDCDGSETPDAVHEMTKEYPATLLNLWERGTPTHGAFRATAVVIDPPDNYSEVPDFAWPLSREISQFAVSELEATALGYGAGVLLDEETDRLRDLRESYRSSPVRRAVDHLPVKDAEGVRYRLYLRDTLPFEDESGLVRPVVSTGE